MFMGGGLNALATLNTIAIATRRVQQSRNPDSQNTINQEINDNYQPADEPPKLK